jgi:16S rRNA (guanine527-N7)-methyltransferase
VIRTAVERLSTFASNEGLLLDEEAIGRLVAFVSLLEAWNRKTRLTGDRDVETLVAKHCADSLVAATELSGGGRAVDIGSGAGFPGLVAACVRWDVGLTLVDSRQRVCSFLNAAAARISLPSLRVVNSRIEDLSRVDEEAAGYDTVISRGVRLGPLLPSVRALLRSSGILLAMVSARQQMPEHDVRKAGLVEKGVRSYALPTGEERRIIRYAPT